MHRGKATCGHWEDGCLQAKERGFAAKTGYPDFGFSTFRTVGKLASVESVCSVL